MKNAILLKHLLDLLFLILKLSCLATLLVLVVATVDKANNINLAPKYIAYFISYITCMFYFLRAMYFIRVLTRGYMQNKIFTLDQTINLKKAGNSFIVCAALLCLIKLLSFIVKLTYSTLEISIDKTFLMACLALILGLFLKIQAQVLNQATHYKKDADLTI